MPPELLELELEEELLEEDELLEELLLEEVLLDELLDEVLLDDVLLDEELLDEELLLDEGWPPQPTSKLPEIRPRPAIRKKRLKLFIGLPPFLEKPAPLNGSQRFVIETLMFQITISSHDYCYYKVSVIVF
jgi:hypothetical protein